MKTPWDIGAITNLLEEIAAAVAVPRFRQLPSHEISSKATLQDPEDLVTVVDREIEHRVSAALAALTPSAPVIGEEAAHDDPRLLDVLARDDGVWVLDPIDGTRNFANGVDAFGLMLAWVVTGRARAAWIVLPARRETFVAEEGSGAWLNGARIAVDPTPPRQRLRGAMMTRYMPEPLATSVRHAARHVQVLSGSGAAAVEYTDVLRGRQDFAVYYRLLPWDHAAPALVLTEAGGAVEHLNGARYSARSAHQITVVARHASVSQQLREWIDAGIDERRHDSRPRG